MGIKRSMFVVLLLFVGFLFSSSSPQPGDVMWDPYDCTKFFLYDGDDWMSMYCPDGLAFNPHKKVCDWAHFVECEGGIGAEFNEICHTGEMVTSDKGKFLFMCDCFSYRFLKNVYFSTCVIRNYPRPS